MFRIVLVVALASTGFNVSSAQVTLLTYEQLDSKATEQLGQLSRAEFAVFAVDFLSQHSLNSLSEVLVRKPYPSLRLAAYYASIEREAGLKYIQLMRLLINAESIIFYDAEVQLLEKIDRRELEPVVANFLAQELDEQRLGNLQFILRSMPVYDEAGMKTVLKNESITASGLAVWVEEFCRRNRDWQSSSVKPLVIESMSKIKNVPGRPQVTILWNFPFNQATDVIPHIRFILDDATIQEPLVLLVLNRFKQLIAENEKMLIAESRNKDLAEQRLEKILRKNDK